MVNKKANSGPSLFDVIEREEAKDEAKKGECSHKFEKPTLTIWPGENFERMTWTCEMCGRITGRMP